MPLYKMNNDDFEPLEKTRFDMNNIKERQDIQRLLKKQIEVIDDGILIIAEEFRNWEGSNRSIDLLGIDKEGNIVVIELKRDTKGGYMELQAIRYAAMIDTISLSFQQAVEIYQDYLRSEGDEDTDAEQDILDHLEWDEIHEDLFAQDVKIILVSADFSNELITSVLWLNERNLDIKCIRMKPYKHKCNGEKEILVDFQKAIPLPGAEDYFIGLRKKKAVEKATSKQNRDLSKFDILVGGEYLNKKPLSKRKTMLTLVKFLIDEKNVHPNEIMAHMPGGEKGKAMINLGSGIKPENAHQATNNYLFNARRKEDNPAKRYFTKKDQLIKHGGKVYVLTSQWSGGADNKKFSATRDKLMEVFSDKFNISVELSLDDLSDVKFSFFVGKKCRGEMLSKLDTMFMVVKFLAGEKGIDPNEIKKCFPSGDRCMRVYSGNKEEAIKAFQKDWEIKNETDLKLVYFINSDEVFEYKDKTYFLAKGWPVDIFRDATDKLMDKFSKFDILIQPS